MRGTTPPRAVAYNRLKRSECAAKTNNISLADKKAAVRDPRRRGSDDVAGDAHSIDEARHTEAQPVAIAVLLKTETRTKPLLLYVLAPVELKTNPNGPVDCSEKHDPRALGRHKSRTQTPSSRSFFDDIA